MNELHTMLPNRATLPAAPAQIKDDKYDILSEDLSKKLNSIIKIVFHARNIDSFYAKDGNRKSSMACSDLFDGSNERILK